MAGSMYDKRRDTRRRNAAGRVIGSKNGCRYTAPGVGKFLKRRLNKAYRREWKMRLVCPYRAGSHGALAELKWRGT